MLPEVWPAGQARLAAARVLVVGCGGLGAPVISSLVAAGVGHLTLVDDDTVEASNLNRQVLFTEADLGRQKAEVAAERARALCSTADVVAKAVRLAAGGVRAAVRGFSVVIDCSDGLPTKFLLNDAFVREDVPLVHGAATAWSGQVLVVPGRRGPCLRCLFEGPLPAGAQPTCRTAGILGAVTGVVGSFQAAEAVKLLVGNPNVLSGRLLAVDVLAPSVRAVGFARRADCPACGDSPTVDATNPADYAPDGDDCDVP
mgnify:FL=1